MLDVQGLLLRFGRRTIFNDVSFRLGAGQRVALAGRNGQGKSTLFRVIMGEAAGEQGEVNLGKGRTVGYLAQDVAPPEEETTVVAEVLSGIPELGQLEKKVERLLVELGENPEDEKVLNAYGRAQARFEELGGYSAEAKARTILHGLGFSQERMNGPLNQLSGGWLMRVQLARLLLMQPDLLLLDEPTNHLDIETREWLLEFLQGFPGTILLTSHDRFFLDALVSKVFELESGRLEVYVGNYSKYEIEREERLRRLRMAHAQQQRYFKQQERFIERNRANATTASNVQSRIKQLDKIERIELPPEPPKMKLRFPEPERSGHVALKLQGLAKRYGDLTVFSGLDLEVENGEKLVVTGVNGAGKSTLLRLIADVDQPSEGTVKRGHNVTVQYFSQYEDDIADSTQTLLQVMQASMPLKSTINPRTVLGCFLFSGDDVDKQIGMLSGGERARLKIARMLLRPANLLVLDEPTNHLDLHSQDLLFRAVSDFKGTCVFVSHDREFIRRLATSVLSIEDGRVRHFPCDYEQYRWRLAQEAKERADYEKSRAAPSKPSQPSKPAKSSKAGKPKPNRKTRERRRWERKAEELQQKIEAAEARVGELEALMGEAGFFDDQERSVPLIYEHKELQQAIEADYESLEFALQSLESES